jgi:hypothetical protein
MSSARTGTGNSALEPLEQETVARVKWRLIPLLFSATTLHIWTV